MNPEPADPLTSMQEVFSAARRDWDSRPPPPPPPEPLVAEFSVSLADLGVPPGDAHVDLKRYLVELMQRTASGPTRGGPVIQLLADLASIPPGGPVRAKVRGLMPPEAAAVSRSLHITAERLASYDPYGPDRPPWLATAMHRLAGAWDHYARIEPEQPVQLREARSRFGPTWIE